MKTSQPHYKKRKPVSAPESGQSNKFSPSQPASQWYLIAVTQVEAVTGKNHSLKTALSQSVTLLAHLNFAL